MKEFKYISVNETVENEITSIKKEILLSMNGICAEKIEDSGFNYTKNFGVSWSRLQEIAKNHTRNFQLAERLWWSNVREESLLATLLLPPSSMDEQKIDDWAKHINTTELAEIFSLKIASQHKNLAHLYLRWLAGDNPYRRLAAVHTFARIISSLEKNEQKQILRSLPTFLDEISLYRGVGAVIDNLLFRESPLYDEIAHYVGQTGGIYSQQLKLTTQQELDICKSKN